MTETGVAFPVQTKKKMRVVIRDTFEEIESDPTEFLLNQLDPLEKNEKDIVSAVQDNNNVPVPEVTRIAESKAEFLKSGTIFTSEHRCLNYDVDYFEPLTYYADEIDIRWVEEYNSHHKFLRVSTKDIERVFEVLEIIVKDSINEDPKISQVLKLLGDDPPPYVIVQAIYDHWKARDKQNGSVIKWREFPPDHCALRQVTTTMTRGLNKIRKGLNDSEYLKRLFKELHEIQQERAKAIEVLQRQQEKQLEDERAVRQSMRKIQKHLGSSSSLILEPPPKPLNEELECVSEPSIINQSSLPHPPTKPTFLRWCMKQEMP